MAPKHNIGPRIRPGTRTFLVRTFSSVNAGAEYVLETFPTLYRRTLTDLKGRFTRDELLSLLDTVNSLMLTPELAGQLLAADLSGALVLDGLAERWGIDGPALEEKIGRLSLWQCAVLEVWLKAYWEVPSTDRTAEGYVRVLSMDPEQPEEE